MSMRGSSNEEIARQLGVKPHTVPHMLADSELLKEYRRELIRLVPKALENVSLLLTAGSGQSVEELGRNTRWLLEGTQVAVRKQTIDGNLEPDPLQHMDRDELMELLRAKLAKMGFALRKTRA